MSTPLRAVYATTDPLAFTGDQIVYLDTTEPGPCKRPGIRMLPQEPRMTTANHVDWLEERIAAETTPRRTRTVAVTHTPIRTAPRVRRARTVGMGEVVVLVVAGLAVIGAGAVGRWVWGR